MLSIYVAVFKNSKHVVVPTGTTSVSEYGGNVSSAA
jgi:hypothetical protein